MDYVILVDQSDMAIGVMEKMEAHVSGRLHRAFSIFLFHPNGDVMLQRRAAQKYHSPGLWTNACCSHPKPNEHVLDAANRRLREELSLNVALNEIFDFTYHASFDNGLIEHELDHVFIGQCESLPSDFNRDEVMEVKWISVTQLEEEIKSNSKAFTPWFLIAWPLVREHYKSHNI